MEKHHSFVTSNNATNKSRRDNYTNLGSRDIKTIRLRILAESIFINSPTKTT